MNESRRRRKRERRDWDWILVTEIFWTHDYIIERILSCKKSSWLWLEIDSLDILVMKDENFQQFKNALLQICFFAAFVMHEGGNSFEEED